MGGYGLKANGINDVWNIGVDAMEYMEKLEGLVMVEVMVGVGDMLVVRYGR